jgi:hypothetical protein
VHLYELEIIKSDSPLFVKWVHHIHLFLVQKLFTLKHKTHPHSETIKTDTPKLKNKNNRNNIIKNIENYVNKVEMLIDENHNYQRKKRKSKPNPRYLD